MLKDVILTLKLRLTYKTNSFINSFRTIPFIGKYIPYEFYSISSLKAGLGVLIFIFLLFIGYPIMYFLYVLAMYLIGDLLNSESTIIFPLIFLGFAIVMSIIIPSAIRADRDSEYAINSMHMPAKRYILSNYIYKMLTLLIGLILGVLIIRLISLLPKLATIPLKNVLLLPIVYVSVKNIITNLRINFIDKKYIYYIFCSLLLIFYSILIPIYIYYYDSLEAILSVYFIILIILGIISLISIERFNNYRYIFKKFYNSKLAKKSMQEIEIENITNTIDNSANITSDKHGYDLLHELFIKRHYKILLKPIKEFSIIEAIVVLGIIGLCIMVPEIRGNIKDVLENNGLYFLALLYFINRGEKLTKAMFMNCDHAMLTFRIYRSPKVILEMFKRRMKTSVLLNLIPALVLAVGSLIVLIIVKSGIMNILLFPLTLLFLSVFFSIHNLVMYYLLQPYNSNTEAKSKSYSMVKGVTYIICVYPALYWDVHLPIELFSVLCIALSIVYIIASLYIVKEYAPKMFKIAYE